MEEHAIFLRSGFIPSSGQTNHTRQYPALIPVFTDTPGMTDDGRLEVKG